MASEHSFDVVSRTDLQEVDNAVNQALKEIRQRFDLKNTRSEIRREGDVVILASDDAYKLKAVNDILQSKLVRRGVDLKALRYGKVEPAAGGTVRQQATLQQGIPQDKAKEMVKAIKGTKLKVQAHIQGDQIRVSGKSKDDLQAVIRLLRERDWGIPVQFTNYR